MPRPIHFELSADDPNRAIAFYEKALGWKFQRYGDMDYWLAQTGDESEPGIHGALQPRREGWPALVETVGVTSLEDSVAAVEANGGRVIERRMVVPGVGYLAYCYDTEGNAFGMMQNDPGASM
jgi:uncharacterized protein